ncbi:hypothetical protein EC968_000646 [Mortierella alpina]|nr:hypothetical protein EC968_000646 [Mortierella alpina]
MSGKLPPDQRVKWGYFDAGDYMKFTLPLSFVLAETCYSGLEFYDGYVLAQQTHALDQMLRWGLDWLLQAHASNNDTLVVQVGVKEVDNEYWGPDTSIPTPRPTFFVNSSRPGTDVMASTAAAFAACSMLYREKFKDSVYADTLQSHGEVLYHWSEAAQPLQLSQKAVPALKGLYESSSFWDDLAWGAAWMYRLTKNQTFADKASQYMANYTLALKPSDYRLPPIGWDDKSGLVYVLMAQLTRGTDQGARWQTMAEQFAEAMTQATAPCLFTPGGMLYCDGYSSDNSLVVIENAALAMYLLAQDMEASLNQNKESTMIRGKIDAYRAFALKQVRYLLGENPEKTPYVVGIHPNSPVNPHSAQASGGNSTRTINTYPVKEAHVLLGALVGGPDVKDIFLDIRDGWRHTEVALDYNAPFTALMAYQVLTSKDPPPYVTITGGSSSQQNSSGDLASWKIALIVIFVGLLLPGLAMYLFYRQKKTQIHAWIAARKGGREEPSATKEDMLPTTAAAAATDHHHSESVSTLNEVSQEEAENKILVHETSAIIESTSASPATASDEQLVHSIESLQTLKSVEVNK